MLDLEPVELPHKILMVNSNRGFVGGVERFMVQMASILRGQNWEIYGLFEQTAFQHPEFDKAFDDFEVLDYLELEDLIEDYIDMGIELVCFHKVTKWQWVKQLQSKFVNVVIVHDHDYYCLRRHKYFPFRRINCSLPFSTIYCPMCAGMLEKREQSFKLIDVEQKYLTLKHIRECNISFVLSDFMKDNLLMNKWQTSKIHKLIPAQIPYNGLQSNERSSIPVILYVGQLIRGKGVDLLLKSLALINTPFKCIILGRGNDQKYLEGLADKLNLNSRVEFREWTNAVSAVYQESDLLVVPSRWQEPYGLIGLEAFAHKLPVIAFDIGGISEWLSHNANGILVKPKDIKRLAAAIRALLSDKSRRLKLGNYGFEEVRAEHSAESFYRSFISPLATYLSFISKGEITINEHE
ncbi:MAG: hypothetical protein CVU48_03085 [Candidatus Cloacimonetes bacterium HGW-Cloacimonetes-1]|jgi:glycosyltransferase involved in cell wall biosynthesis|nr:MAG: hypothetical protein CVU48_03085 [Candidatus Cloacimonetes bacterium HGW-Cloacimonetes-1]